MKRLALLCVVLAACGSDDATRTRCKNGDGAACFELGKARAVMAERTHEKRHLEGAFASWQRGCKLHHGASCAQVGYLLESGKLGYDASMASMFYELACEFDPAICAENKNGRGPKTAPE